MREDEIFTLLKDVCSGETASDLFLVAAVHPEEARLDTTSLLVHLDVSGPQAKHHILLNARKEMDDVEDRSSFESLTKDKGVLYIGNSGGDCVAYANGAFDRLRFDTLKPYPGGVYCSQGMGHGRVLFGAYEGVVIDCQHGQAVATCVFEDDVALKWVTAMHGVGEDFVIAVGGRCAAQFDGTNWTRIDLPTQDRVQGVWCRSRSEVYFCADSLWRWDGLAGWKSISWSLGHEHQRMCDVAEFNGHVYVAVGIDGLLRLEGNRLVQVDIGAPAVIGKLRVTEAGLIGLGTWSDGGRWFVRFDGEHWTSFELDFSDEYCE